MYSPFSSALFSHRYDGLGCCLDRMMWVNCAQRCNPRSMWCQYSVNNYNDDDDDDDVDDDIIISSCNYKQKWNIKIRVLACTLAHKNKIIGIYKYKFWIKKNNQTELMNKINQTNRKYNEKKRRWRGIATHWEFFIKFVSHLATYQSF